MKNIVILSVVSAMLVAPLTFAGDASKHPVVEITKQTFDSDDTFNFDFDGPIVMEGSKELADQRMAEIAQFLKDNDGYQVRIEGFADETGTAVYNYVLASKRVNDLTRRLLNNGITLDRIIRVPYGEMNTLVDGHSDEAWAANRRVRVRIIAK